MKTYDFTKIEKYTKEEQCKLFLDKDFLDSVNIDNYNFYKIFVNLIKNNQEEFQKLIFNNLDLLKVFIKGESLNYYKISFSLDFLLNLVKCLEKNNLEYDELYLLIYYNIKDSTLQTKFLSSDVPNSLKRKLLRMFKKEVVDSYIEKENIYLTDKEIYTFLTTGINVPTRYYQNKRFFLDQIMDPNITLMNEKINTINGYQTNNFFNELKYEMFDKIILSYKDSKFNINSSLENAFITKYKEYYKGNNIDKKLLINIIIDNLFEDNLRNVCLNIKELFSFNEKVLKIENSHLDFYEKIININEFSIEEIIEFYKKYKKYPVKEMFYDDLRKLKDIAYKNILDSCFRLEDNNNLLNEELSKKYNTSIYELKGEPFTCLISCLNREQQDLHEFKRNCYSLIDQNNLNVFIDGVLVYGYTDVLPDHIMHVFEQDAYSLSFVGSTDFVNRIRDKDFILNSHTANEIQILNDLYDSKTRTYKRIKPAYLICFDNIDEKTLKASRERNNLPIVLINKKMYKVNERKEYVNQKKDDMYYTGDTIKYRSANYSISEDSFDNKKI